MKFKTLLTATALTFAATAFASEGHGHDAKPMHGGIVTKASDIEFELVAKADGVTVYVRDHGKPASTQGATGKLTVLSGGQKVEATLTPAGDNKLEGKGSFSVAPGTKFVATVTLQGKQPANMRFALK